MRLPTLSKAALAAVVVMFSLSCMLLENAVPQAGETPSVASPSSGVVLPASSEAVPAEMEEVTDPRVEGTLALRSVQMELQTAFPGEDVNRTLISVDAAGNVRIESLLPVFKDSVLTPESPDWNVFEIYIVDGKGYTRSGRTGSAEADPDQNDVLSEILYSPTGPGMWLILLPEESFTSAGKESKGGFDTEKFNVKGSLELGEIRGEFWIDEPTGALVGANLSLDEGIFHPFEESTGEVVTITFSVEKTDVPTITVP
jgi:hypothetical protein